MTLELMRDAEREDGWWLLVDGSEQSFVDTSDPLHLEFEYVQMIAHFLEVRFGDDGPITALHLGGGLSTVPRWLAVTHPRSKQRVIEKSAEIAGLAASLGMPAGVQVEIADAVAVISRAGRGKTDVIVCDVYDGPETVTSLFTLDAVSTTRRLLRRDGVLICNLSDAAPFALSRVVVATLRAVFSTVVLLAEPPVLRGRRSGNLVLAATDGELLLTELTRRASGGAVRSRVVADDDLSEFVGDAAVAQMLSDLPLSGESTGRRLL